MGVAITPAPAAGFEDQLEAGIEGGYSNLTRRAASDPPLALGGGGGVRVRYGLTDWLGVILAGRMTWYAAYRPSAQTTVPNPDDPEGEPIPAVVYGARTERIHVRGLSFSLLYASRQTTTYFQILSMILFLPVI